MPELLARTLRAFDGAELNYCVLRDADRLADLAGGGRSMFWWTPGTSTRSAGAWRGSGSRSSRARGMRRITSSSATTRRRTAG